MLQGATHEKGERVRYFADDDKQSLADMVLKEKMGVNQDAFIFLMIASYFDHVICFMQSSNINSYINAQALERAPMIYFTGSQARQCRQPQSMTTTSPWMTCTSLV